ncbi:MAG: GNAT family N-acetyltransferase [Pseudobdellovibrionaceae bacterium]|nr:MAG: GNAT family N-acetyltransferase [Pseudobdellovibrionaceae bacterium]
MNFDIKIAKKVDLEGVLKQLRRQGVANAWSIQDLTVWPNQSKFFYVQNSDQFSYLLISGHPASHGHPTLIANGNEDAVKSLFISAELHEPFVVRETPAHLLPVIEELYPDAKVFLEQRMDVSRNTYIPQHTGNARKLSGDDANYLAKFFGAPPQAAERFKGWLNGAKLFLGIFVEDRLAAIGSSMVSIPEAWNLVSIETHKDFRRRGLATEITSALVSHALEFTQIVTVTVVKSNLPAVHTYEKIGFDFAEDRIWVDNGTGSKP